MPIQIGDDDAPPPPTRAEKLAPWLRRILIGGCLIWVCISIQNYSEDTRSHTIKASFPLLMGYEKITARGDDFDPQKADWQPLQSGFSVPDGAVFFVRTGGDTYAVKMVQQTIQPEAASYEWLKVGTTAPLVGAKAEPFPDGIALPGLKIGWSSHQNGAGFLYLDDAFIWDRKPRYSIGVPFQSGELEAYRTTVPARVHFESVPWKIENANAARPTSRP